MSNDSVIDRDNTSTNDNSHIQLQATTSTIARTNGGYYLHPPDIILPPGLELSAASGSDVTIGDGTSLQIASVVTTTASGLQHQANVNGSQIKSEYDVPSTSLPTTSSAISSQLVFLLLN